MPVKKVDCKQKRSTKWKKLTVTISACKSLQVLVVTLVVTVDFFSIYSQPFFTGAVSYSRLFVTVSVVHLPHFVQCITILITICHILYNVSQYRCSWGGQLKSIGGGNWKQKNCLHSPRGVTENEPFWKCFTSLAQCLILVFFIADYSQIPPPQAEAGVSVSIAIIGVDSSNP